jgi:hypothetical protein
MDTRDLLPFLSQLGVQPQPVEDVPIVEPAPTPIPVAPPAVPSQAPTSSGASMGARAFSPTKYAQVTSTSGSRIERKMAAADAQVEKDFAPLKVKQDLAANAQIGAQKAVGQAEADKAMALVDDPDAPGEQVSRHVLMQRMYQKHETEIQGITTQAKVAGDAAKAQYATALQAIPSLNPNQLWEEAGTAGQYGMAVSAFVHDFLGAKGIKTSAMDTINGAIQRNIQAQLAKIDKGKAVASGFKDMWQMQREQSASDQEAMARMHGIMLKSVQAGIDAQMGKYDSRLALAKSQEARASLEQQIADKALVVQQHIDRTQNDAAQRLIAINGQELQASIASQQIAESRAAREAAAKAKSDPYGGAIIFDNTKSGGGAAKFRIRKELMDDKELVRGVIAKATGTKTAMEGLNELLALQSKMAASPDGINKTRFASEIERREVALRNRIVAALVLDQSGKQVTDQERIYIEKLVPAKTWFTNGNNRRIISQLVEAKGLEMNTLLQQTTADVVEGDPAFGTKMAQGRFADAEITEAGLVKEGAEELKEGPIDAANKLVTSPDNAKVADAALKEEMKTTVGASAIEGRWKDFLTLVPGATGAISPAKTSGTLEDQFESGREVAETNQKAWANPDKPTKAFVGFDTYRRLAAGGDQKALEQLNLWVNMDGAGKAPDGSDPQSPEAQRKHMMAVWAISELKRGN